MRSAIRKRKTPDITPLSLILLVFVETAAPFKNLISNALDSMEPFVPILRMSIYSGRCHG